MTLVPRPWTWALPLLAALVFVHLRLAPYAFDDAHIHFRIARHLVTDGAPYFNPGQPVMATSSIAWTLLLAGGFWIGGTVRTVAGIEAVITTLAVMVYAAVIARAAGRGASLADLVLSTIVIGGALLLSSTGLMETPFALLVAGCGIWCLQRDRIVGFAWLAAAVFARLELAALLVTCLAWSGVARRRPIAAIAAILVGALPFVAIDLHFFGTVLPQTIAAKSVGYQLKWIDVWSGVVPGVTSMWVLVVLAGACAVSLVAFTRRRAVTDSLAVASVVAGLIIVGTYVASKGLIFRWYSPLYVVLLSWPLAASARATARPLSRRLVAAGLVVMSVPATLGLYATAKGAFANAAYAPTFVEGARVQQYLEVGRFLDSRFPDAVLLTTEIGGLGEGFRGKIVDAFGLISPEALPFHPMAVPKERASGTLGAIPPRFAAQVNPTLIVSYDIFDVALGRSPVVNGYQRVDLPLFNSREAELLCAANLPVSLWGIRALHVYVRRDLPVPAAWPARPARARGCGA